MANRHVLFQLSSEPAFANRQAIASEGPSFTITLLGANINGKGCDLWATALVIGDHNRLATSDPVGYCAIRNVCKGDEFKATA
jgi:hypothetical protein